MFHNLLLKGAITIILTYLLALYDEKNFDFSFLEKNKTGQLSLLELAIQYLSVVFLTRYKIMRT